MKKPAFTSPTATDGSAPHCESHLLDGLLQRWEELRERGCSVTATELAGDHPELIDTLTRRIQALEAMNAVLDISDPGNTSSNLPTRDQIREETSPESRLRLPSTG